MHRVNIYSRAGPLPPVECLSTSSLMEDILYEPFNTSTSPTQDDPLAAVTVAEDSTQSLEPPSVCFTAGDTTLNPGSERGFKDSTRSFKFSTRSFKDSTRRSKISTRSLFKKSRRRNSEAKASSFKWSDAVNAVIQAAGLITAVVFGVWAVRTYDVARNSLGRADIANDLTARGVRIALAANNLTERALEIANNTNILTREALKIARDANTQAREIAHTTHLLTRTSNVIALAANDQAQKIANTSHNLTSQALAIALDANTQAGKIANTTNHLTRRSHAIAKASIHQTEVQNMLANSLQLLSFCASAQTKPPSNLTDLCASITLRLWSFVTSSVVPTTSPENPDTQEFVNVPHNLSTSTSSTLPRTATTTRHSASISPTRRPSAPASPTTMGPAASTQQTTARPSVSTLPTPPPTTERPSPISASHRRKKPMQLSVIVGIVVAVVVFFVAVGAWLSVP